MLAVFLLSAPSTVRLHGAASDRCGCAVLPRGQLNVNEQSSLSAYSLSRSNMLQVDLVPRPSSHLVSWSLVPLAFGFALELGEHIYTCGHVRPAPAVFSSRIFQLLLLYCTAEPGNVQTVFDREWRSRTASF